eukprot:12244349-Alexandrium_andersonii.AAC.1
MQHQIVSGGRFANAERQTAHRRNAHALASSGLHGRGRQERSGRARRATCSVQAPLSLSLIHI